jgi:hypothetical protein
LDYGAAENEEVYYGEEVNLQFSFGFGSDFHPGPTVDEIADYGSLVAYYEKWRPEGEDHLEPILSRTCAPADFGADETFK